MSQREHPSEKVTKLNLYMEHLIWICLFDHDLNCKVDSYEKMKKNSIISPVASKVTLS